MRFVSCIGQLGQRGGCHECLLLRTSAVNERFLNRAPLNTALTLPTQDTGVNPNFAHAGRRIAAHLTPRRAASVPQSFNSTIKSCTVLSPAFSSACCATPPQRT